MRSDITLSIDDFLQRVCKNKEIPTIPFLDIQLINQNHTTGLECALDKVIRSGWYILLPSASKIGHTEFVSNPQFTWPGNGGDLFIIGVRWE